MAGLLRGLKVSASTVGREIERKERERVIRDLNGESTVDTEPESDSNGGIIKTIHGFHEKISPRMSPFLDTVGDDLVRPRELLDEKTGRLICQTETDYETDVEFQSLPFEFETELDSESETTETNNNNITDRYMLKGLSLLWDKVASSVDPKTGENRLGKELVEFQSLSDSKYGNLQQGLSALNFIEKDNLWKFKKGTVLDEICPDVDKVVVSEKKDREAGVYFKFQDSDDSDSDYYSDEFLVYKACKRVHEEILTVRRLLGRDKNPGDY